MVNSSHAYFISFYLWGRKITKRKILNLPLLQLSCVKQGNASLIWAISNHLSAAKDVTLLKSGSIGPMIVPSAKGAWIVWRIPSAVLYGRNSTRKKRTSAQSRSPIDSLYNKEKKQRFANLRNNCKIKSKKLQQALDRIDAKEVKLAVSKKMYDHMKKVSE